MMSVYTTSISDLSYPVNGETTVEDESYFSTHTSFETEDSEAAFVADDGCFLNPPSLPTPSSPDEEASRPLTLTPEQQQVLEHVRAGKNVFFTGSGGTGKTLVLQEILKFFRKKFYKGHSQYRYTGCACPCFSCQVAVTAPTGIAAIPIGGTTLHSASGIGIPLRPTDFNRMWHKPIRMKWRNLSVLIVDEISMVSAELLEYLEQIIRRIRTRKALLPGEPFGGLQVIFAGDFFQLQPVEDKDTHSAADQFLNRGLAFEAPAWERAKFNTVILSRVFRQEDNHFVDLLNGIRTGENIAAFEEIFLRCRRTLPIANGIRPTVLYSKNIDVDKFNNDKLNALPGRNVRIVADERIESKEGFKAPDQRDTSRQELQQKILEAADFWRDCRAPTEINLRVGAQVMLLRNLILEGTERDLVNGSRGILVGWRLKDELLDENLELLKCYYNDLRTGSETDGARKARLRLEQKVINLRNSHICEVPIVRFRNGQVITCVPEKFSYEILNVGECIRWQVPLKLAWALTIHKCQGMTLDYVQVTLDGIFAEGQVYVALSRARSMEGLQVVGMYNSRDVRVSQKVVDFYRALAAKESPFVGKYVFPDMEFVIPPEEVIAKRRRVDGILVN